MSIVTFIIESTAYYNMVKKMSVHLFIFIDELCTELVQLFILRMISSYQFYRN